MLARACGDRPINPWRGEPPWTDWPETVFEHSVQLPVSPEGLVTDCLFIHAEGRDQSPRSSVPSQGAAAQLGTGLTALPSESDGSLPREVRRRLGCMDASLPRE